MKISKPLIAAVAFSVCLNANADYFGDAPNSGIHDFEQILVDHPGEKIDLFSGQLSLHNVDILIPGNGGFDIKVERTYRSRPTDYFEPVGLNWSIHFGRLKTSLASNLACDPINLTSFVFELPDGQTQTFYRPSLAHPSASLTGLSANTFVSPSMWRLNCIAVSTGGYGDGFEVISPSGMRYEMTSIIAPGTSGAYVYPSRISDRNGNFLSFSYIFTPPLTSSSTVAADYPLVSTVTASSANGISDGRSLTFTYDQNTFYLSKIATGDGRVWNYQYQKEQVILPFVSNNYQLTKVIRPDQSFWGYQYFDPASYPAQLDDVHASAGRIKVVTYPEGANINYGYTYSTVSGMYSGVYVGYAFSVLKSKLATDGGNWGFDFSFAPTSTDVDVTTVTAPDKTIVAKHFGYHSVSSSNCWQIGLPISKTITPKAGGVPQIESYSWLPVTISDVQPPWPVIEGICSDVSNPILNTVAVTRDGASFNTSYSNFDGFANPQTIAETGPDSSVASGRSSRTTNLTYNNDVTKWVVNQVKDEVVVGGRSTTRTFDANHNVKSITMDGVTTSYTYNPDGIVNGTIATMALPRPGQTHAYSSYKRGIPQLENQPEGISITRVVSDAGTVLSEKNGRGFTTSYTYDDLNRPKTITYPVDPSSPSGHNSVSIVYTANSKTATRGTGPTALVESTIYDGFGRPTSVTLGGIQTTYHYDPLGRMDFKSNPGGTLVTSYAYDALDRVKTITYADNNLKSYTYGAASMSVKDERLNTTSYAYRAYGDPNKTHLMQITAPVPAANIAITRTARDQIETVTQGGLTRSYKYYTTGYLNTVTDPEIGITTYGRDEAGNMATRSVGTSGSTIYTYDLQNRLTYVTFPGATPQIHYTYTNTNKLRTVSSGATTRTFDYDATDNLISDALSIDGYNFNVGFGYNANDQLSSITYPKSNKTVLFAPDVLGRPTSPTDAVAGPYVSNVNYWPSGQAKQISYQNGVVTNYGQDTNRLWPKTFSTQKGVLTPYVNNIYDYDAVGNLKTIADTNTTDFNRGFDYDTINRLTTINGSWGLGSIVYDGVGNISSQTFGAAGLSYGYSPQNRLSAVIGTLRNASYTYDTSYGNIIADGAGKTFGYDDAPNLTSVSDSNSGAAINYVYDGLNKRIKVVKNGVTTYELYDFSGKLLAEFTLGAPSKLVEYVYLGNIRIAQRLSYQ
jgi:YD repeat-containing protein